MNKEPLVDAAAWIILLSAVDLWTVLSVCHFSCNKPLFSSLGDVLTVNIMEDLFYFYFYLYIFEGSWGGGFLGAKWTRVLVTFKEFRALSPDQVCHSKSDVAFFLSHDYFSHDYSKQSSHEVAVLLILPLRRSPAYVSIFDTWPAECIGVAAAERLAPWGREMVYSLTRPKFYVSLAEKNSPFKLRPDLSSCCCLYSCNTHTLTHTCARQVFKCIFVVNAVSLAKRVNVTSKQKKNNSFV